MTSLRTAGSRVQKVTALASLPSLGGTTAVVTGGTDGVGRALVEQLARAGATVVFTARDPHKGQRVETEVIRSTGNHDVHVVELDLADLASVDRGSASIAAAHGSIDLLLANAAHQARGARTVTVDGFETTFGVNHLAHVRLISLLDEPLRTGAPSRIVVVASEAHRRARGGLDFDDLMMERGRFRPRLAYNRSKLANILYARELAFRLDGSGVTVHAAHPGGVDTPMLQRSFQHPLVRPLYPLMRDHVLITPDDAAAGVLRVALDPRCATSSGDYFELGRNARPSSDAQDDRAAQRLWSVTRDLVGTTA